ncbi:MAG: cell surface protein SprA [Parvicellaceae bacterium]|jgi:cell surface protein SprA
MVIWTATAASGIYSSSYDASWSAPTAYDDEGYVDFNSMRSVKVDSPDIDLIYPLNDPVDPTQDANNLIDLEDPENINNNVYYDPVTGQYIFNSTVGEDFDYRNSSFMTKDEYFQYDLDKSLDEYWKKQVAGEGIGETSLIPHLNVGGAKFQDIFGSNKINIQPQGSAELRFGVNISRTDNPQLPEKQRRITTFDFDEKIQLNVTGQIGEKLKLQTSYNTEATFDFENQMKLEYTGFEDEIIKKIEAGNVSLPLNGSLIQGGSSLFGLKTQLQFGRATVTSIFSQQKGQRKEINVAGGAQVSEFEVSTDNYEANKHYFLNYYHRNNYDDAMVDLPIVNSGVQITRIEVWVTNRTNDFTDTRNIIAFTDLGEKDSLEIAGGYGGLPASTVLPNNNSNGLHQYVLGNPNVRGFVNSSAALGSGTYPMTQAVHYEKLENARMLLPTEYDYNAQLGFISLNQSLNNDEVLAVAYQYTYLGATHQVGEFSTDGITGTDALYLKLLKSTVTNPRKMLWDLMMKNVYSIGAYQVSQKNFRLDVWYNNPTTSVDVNFIPKPGVDGIPLVRLIGLDRYNAQQFNTPDGVFDFIPLTAQNGKIENGGTINTRNGRVYFTTIEPFGSYLDQELTAKGVDPITRSQTVYQALYDSTQTAARQIPELNRFKLKGTYESSSSSEIALNALNIPRGSVTVTAGGVPLNEGQDYTVDYNLGRVKILNDGILSSGTPIKISLESNSLFSIQSKTLMGSHMDYKVNKDFNLGATVMNLTERPLTQKVNQGDEPISNTIFGVNGDFRKEVPFLTKLVDKIPGINTKEKSTVSITGEAAYLLPGFNKAIGDEGTSYIDDFEGSQSAIDIRSFTTWVPASIPQGQPSLFPEASYTDDLRAGMNRAKLAWYVIDPLFHNDNSLTPSNIAGSPFQDMHTQRRVLVEELFPNKDLGTGQPTFIGVFDLAYYPNVRGIYNYDDGTYAAGLNPLNGQLLNPEDRWAGIMRSLTTNDFEAANIQYIQFWMMDPFSGTIGTNVDSRNSTGGDFYINIGNISEDIIKDGAKSFENGNSTDGSFDTTVTRETNLARVPTTQVIVNAFDNDLTARPNQDIGLDGLSDADERDFYSDFAAYVQGLGLPTVVRDSILNDISADNYNYYRDDDYDLNPDADMLTRYMMYNGHDGNSPTTDESATLNVDGYPTSATTLPNVEDINQDNNLNEAEAYFQYHINLRPENMNVGENYITDQVVGSYNNGTTTSLVNWYQFKIPIASPTSRINGIQDFRSIRFIRMFMKNFDKPLVTRFGRLELIRGEWRSYLRELWTPGDYIQSEESGTTFNIGAVNIEENDNYVVPPGINRQVNVQTQNLARLNEQSMVLEVCNLKDGDARAAFRNTSFDVLSYKKLRMFVHAHETDQSKPLINNDLTCFIRLGTDFEDNYYEYEVPLTVSPNNSGVAEDVWPEANNIVIDFSKLKGLKLIRPGGLSTGGLTPYIVPDPDDPTRRITIVGNPTLAGIKTIMIGVRNPWKDDPTHQWQPDDGLEKCAEVWVNELRLTDFDDFGGWAAQGRLTAQLADLASVAFSGGISTPGFGSIEKRISERQRETIRTFDASSTIQLGKFFGDKSGVSLPMYIGYGDITIDPMFDPLNPDILMKELPQSESNASAARDYTQRKSLNFTNVRIDRKKEGAQPHFWDVRNLTYSFSYNQSYRRDINTQFNTQKNYNTSLIYSYNPNSKPWKPFAKSKFLRKSKWLRFIKDFNLYPKPKSVSVRTTIDRGYNESQIRGNYNAITIPQFFKTFNWNRGYDFKYDITKALKVDFSVNNNAIIRENRDWVNKDWYPEEYQNFKDTVLESIAHWGTTMQYGHGLNVTYQLPLNKFPFTDWINVSTRLAVAYDWGRAPLAQSELGNTIQNSRKVNWNAQANMTNLYNKIPYLKKVNKKFGRKGGNSRRRASKPKPVVKDTSAAGDTAKKVREPIDFNVLEQSARVIMMLKNVNFTFSTTDGVLLPGYTPSTNVFGASPWDADPNTISGPGYQFALGGHQKFDLLGRATGNDFAEFAALNGWILDSVNSQRLNTQYTTNHASNITGKATIEPFGGVRIDLSLTQNSSVNTTDNFRFSDSVFDPFSSMTVYDPGYHHQNPVETGTFSSSLITWRTAFESDTTNTSAIFTELRDNRAVVSQILADANANSLGAHAEDLGYTDGYGEGQQDVILGAFLAAYTGKTPGKKNINPFSVIPLPNWRITIDGNKFKFMKKRFKSLSFKHSYRSNFTIGSYTTNLNSSANAAGLVSRDISGNFISDKQILTASIMEQFAPLLGIDATLKNSLILKIEYKKDRNVALSLANNQITEIKGNELVIGSGYRFDDVMLPFKINGKKPVSNLNIRVDISIRGNKTITRKIIENQNQVTAGQRLISIKATADYQLGKALSVRAYFDRIITKPFISTAFPTANTNAGLALRFTLQ